MGGRCAIVVAMHALSIIYELKLKDTTGDVWIVYGANIGRKMGKTEIISLSPFAKTKEVCRPCGAPAHITSQPFLSLD